MLFAAVAGLARMRDAQQLALASQWSQRGAADMNAQRYGAAVIDFQTARLYSRDNDTYALDLAQALLGNGQTNEAAAYLTNLWERQPENGLVNLELAHIAARKNENERAIRYYHNAIYATWPNNDEHERRSARLELVELFLHNGQNAQAQAELIALSANVDEDPAIRTRIGNLFLEAQDSLHALAEFQISLRTKPHDPSALAGAGRAAFEQGRFTQAQRYLQEAIAAAPEDKDSAERLRLASLVIEMDPFRQGLRAKQRAEAVVNAFAAAEKRLAACKGASWSTAAMQRQILAQKWAAMKPQVTERNLRSDPDMVDSVMEVVFGVERRTEGGCGDTSESDRALLLIAKQHEGL